MFALMTWHCAFILPFDYLKVYVCVSLATHGFTTLNARHSAMVAQIHFILVIWYINVSLYGLTFLSYWFNTSKQLKRVNNKLSIWHFEYMLYLLWLLTPWQQNKIVEVLEVLAHNSVWWRKVLLNRVLILMLILSSPSSELTISFFVNLGIPYLFVSINS